MARTTGLKKGWGRDAGSRPGHHKEDFDAFSGPAKGAGERYKSRSFGDEGNVHGSNHMKGQLAAPKRKLPNVDKVIERAGHSDYGTGGRLINGVEPGGEYDPLPVSYHRNSGTSSAGCKFRGVRGY